MRLLVARAGAPATTGPLRGVAVSREWLEQQVESLPGTPFLDAPGGRQVGAISRGWLEADGTELWAEVTLTEPRLPHELHLSGVQPSINRAPKQ